MPEEPLAPPTDPAVRVLLDDAAKLARDKKLTEALAAADRALAAAREAKDGPGEALSHQERALHLQASGRTAEAAAAWGEAAATWAGCREELRDGPAHVEALIERALLLAPDDPAAADESVGQAVDLARRESTRPLATAGVLHRGADRAVDQRLLEVARRLVEEALRIREARAPRSAEMAESLQLAGYVARQRSDAAAARAYYEGSLAIVEQLEPGSRSVAKHHDLLGNLAFTQGDLPAARNHFEKGLAVSQRTAPASADAGVFLRNLGITTRAQGDLRAARDYHERELRVHQTLAGPEGFSRDVAESLNRLGGVAGAQGDPVAALDYYRRAHLIAEELPASPTLVASLTGMGVAARSLGDLGAARRYHERALALLRKLAGPDAASAPLAETLNNLGSVARQQMKFEEAQAFYESALATGLKLVEPGGSPSAEVAMSLTGLGILARIAEDHARARNFHTRALRIWEDLEPNSPHVAQSLNNLGMIARDQRDNKAAYGFFERAVQSLTRISTGSLDLATPLTNLGALADEEGKLAVAADRFQQAWDIIKVSGMDLIGDEARQAFQEQAYTTNRSLVLTRVALGQTDEALVSLEEGRAQALQHLLLERSRARSDDHAQLWNDYEMARAEYQRAAKELERAVTGTAPPDEIEQRKAAYNRARDMAEARGAALVSALHREAPGRSDPAQAKQRMAPGTLAAVFSVAERATTLFLVTARDPVRTFRIPLGIADLQRRVHRLRVRIGVDHSDEPFDTSSSARDAAAGDLYRTLFPPAAREAIRRARRLVVSPEDALWDLPFAALVTNTGPDPAYLGAQKPLTYAQSFTLYAQSMLGRRSFQRSTLVLIVGDPVLRPDATTFGGDPLPPLDFAVPTARNIARLYGAQPYLKGAPTEAWFRRMAPKARVIDLETHGELHPHIAMDSRVWLAASQPPEADRGTDDDGLLEAWELYDPRLQLQADLVVLAACQTGQGQRARSEGLVGLTRAFQVAGARSVVAAQWEVDDPSTGSLMEKFHRHLLDGLDKDEALRRSMATRAKTFAPKYWAGFILVGNSEGLTK
jgi:CHAT domain-containing protein/Tfp pilus assembly protein PilF